MSAAQTARGPVTAAVDAVEAAEPLDGPGKAIGRAVRGSLGPGAFKDSISGTWLGHALHPLLTDVVIGAWVSANLLDLLGGDANGEATERLLAVGIAAYPPTALTGVSDWADSEVTDPKVRRVGLAHAAANATALGLYTASLLARRRGSRGMGKLLAAAGAGVLGAGGYLGSHMAYAQGVGPNQTAFDEGPQEWTDAGSSDDLAAGSPSRLVAGDTPVLVLRRAGVLYAMHDRCSHRGCSLSDGEIQDDIVTCPCHGSQFGLGDGDVRRGPATSAQPVLDAREVDGRLQVRRRSEGSD